MHQEFARQLLFFHVLLERFGLLQNPGFIGMVTGRRDEDSACFQMQENQDKQIAKAGLRHDLLGVKVALPHGLRMSFNEFGPCARSTFGADIVAVSLEDVFHSIASDRLDSELLQLAENPCVAPRIVLRQLED